MKKILYISLAILLSIAIIIVLFMSYANYSEGTRAGIVVKISKKGYIFKTYEGQLNVGGIATNNGNIVASAWDFSVKRNKKDVIEALEDAQSTGERVKLFYKEKYRKFSWIGDTKYYVYKVEKAEIKNPNNTQ